MIQKVGRYRFLESFDLPFPVTDRGLRRRDQSSSWRAENPRWSFRLQRGRREALILSESSPTTTFSRCLTSALNSDTCHVVFPQVTRRLLLASTHRDPV